MPADKPLLLKQVHVIVDSNTTVVCLDAAGQIQEIDEPFETMNGRFDHPPFHVNCRDWVTPWMPGFASDVRDLARRELRRRPDKETRRKQPPPLDENRPVDTLGRTIARRGGPKGQQGSKPGPRPTAVEFANQILANQGNAQGWQVRALAALLKLDMDEDDLLVAVSLVMTTRLKRQLPKWLLNALRRAESV